MSIAIVVILVVIAVIVVGRGTFRPVDRRANALEVLRRMSEQPSAPPTAVPARRTGRRAAPRPPVRLPARTTALAVGCAVAVVAGIVTVSVRSAGGSPASRTAADRTSVPASLAPPGSRLLPRPTPSRSVAQRPTHARTRPAPPPTSGPTTALRTPATSTPSAPAVNTPPARASGAAPVITGMTPSTGRAGEVVTVAGRALFSADGQIRASFGGTPASIACPTMSTCRVVVPDRAARGGALVLVSVTTASGTSATVPFQYAG